MKKVLLLGDSIRMFYAGYVKEALEGKCEVHYSPDNGCFAAYTLWQANQMFKHEGPFDLVHWNNGYWDMNIEPPMTEAIHPVEEYIHFLRRIIRFIRSQGSKIIFATTTPILGDGSAPDPQTGKIINYSNEWVKTYNAAAKLLMAQENVQVNDLYELCLEHPRYYKCDDLLHLTEEGSRRCAEKIAETILAAL